MYTYMIQMPFPPRISKEHSTHDSIMVANMVLEFEKNELKITSDISFLM